jgi:hypothetical protein
MMEKRVTVTTKNFKETKIFNNSSFIKKGLKKKPFSVGKVKIMPVCFSLGLVKLLNYNILKKKRGQPGHEQCRVRKLE